jgi:hypothetical protein
MSQTQHFCGVGTTVERPDAHTIRGLYRGTCVAQLHTDPETGLRTIRLNHGGWKTATTKMRMNQFSAEFCSGIYSVSQEKGEWFVYYGTSAEHQCRMVFHTQTFTFNL